MLDSGETVADDHDLAARLPGDVLLAKLAAKVRALVPDGAQAIIERTGDLEGCTASGIARLLVPAGS